MDFFTALREELDTQQRLRKLYTDRLALMPEGTLWTKRRKNNTQYYLKLPGVPPHYLDQSQADLISLLQSKQLMTKNLKNINQTLPLLSKLCSSYSSFHSVNVHITDSFSPSENPAYPEALIHNTSFGMKVRSKSEAMIADALHTFQIPQYYERKLLLTDTFGQPYEMYPDFTIPLPDGSFIYWEHKGLMNDVKYRRRNAYKEELYFKNGIYSPKNLIITMDGPHQEFDLQEIHRIIKGLILPRLG